MRTPSNAPAAGSNSSGIWLMYTRGRVNALPSAGGCCRIATAAASKFVTCSANASAFALSGGGLLLVPYVVALTSRTFETVLPKIRRAQMRS